MPSAWNGVEPTSHIALSRQAWPSAPEKVPAYFSNCLYNEDLTESTPRSEVERDLPVKALFLVLGRSKEKGTEISILELKSVSGIVRSKVTSMSVKEEILNVGYKINWKLTQRIVCSQNTSLSPERDIC